MLTLNKRLLYGSILTHKQLPLKLNNNSLARVSGKAWQWPLWLRERPWPQASPFLLIWVWAPVTVQTGWWSVFQREALSLLLGEVTLQCLCGWKCPSFAWWWLGRGWGWVLKLPEKRGVSVLSVSGPSNGCCAPHTRGYTRRRRGRALVGVRCPRLSVYSLWLPKLTLGCSYYLWIFKGSLSRFWQRQNCFSL